jgi:signal transduction histidine kinase
LIKTSEERLELTVLDRTLQLQESLKQQQKTLEQYIRFGSLISHECRNPLGVIESQISLMNKEIGRGINQQEKRLAIVMRATRRLTAIFDRWLQSDRLDSALEEINVHRISTRAWMNKLLEEQSHVADDHPILLSFDHKVELLEADEGLLDIALVNLLDNAAKYSPQHSEIELRTQCHGKWIGISVRDHGRGIDATEHDKVFDEFYRSEPESGVRGMGLGLAMVRRIAQAHGGWVELESALGKGACFTIWLPASPGD